MLPPCAHSDAADASMRQRQRRGNGIANGIANLTAAPTFVPATSDDKPGQDTCPGVAELLAAADVA